MSVNKHRKCCKCGKTRAEDMSVTYHTFPCPGSTNVTKAYAWARYCWPDDADDWTSESLKSLHNASKVLCGRHFSDSQFIDNKRQKLSKFAYPDLSDEEKVTNERENIFVNSPISNEGKEQVLQLQLESPPATKRQKKRKLSQMTSRELKLYEICKKQKREILRLREEIKNIKNTVQMLHKDENIKKLYNLRKKVCLDDEALIVYI